MVVSIFSSITWVISAHKWFQGPIRNIDVGLEKVVHHAEMQLTNEVHEVHGSGHSLSFA